MKHLSHILFLIYCNLSAGQNQQIVDSLNKKLALTTHDTSRVLIFEELANQYRFTNTDRAMQYAQQALTLSREIKYKSGEAAALNIMAFLFREKGNLPLAMELHLKVLEVAHDNKLYNEGGLSMIRIGNIYRDLKDYPTALTYQRQGLATFEGNNYKRGIAIAKMLIGYTFEEKNQLDSALYYEEQVKDDTSKFPEISASMLNILGRIQAKLNNYQLALAYHRQCLELSQLINDYRTSSQAYTYIAQLYTQLNQRDSSVFYAGKALLSAQQVSNKAGILNAANLLSEIYEPIDIRKAFEYNKMAAAAKDSLYSNEKVQALQTITFNEQERKRNFEIAKKAYQNQIRQYALIAGLAGFIVIALILYRNNRQKHKVNTVLQKTLLNLKLAQSQLIQSEKMASLGELTAGIAHEIQNPLNFVNNFSEVNSELVDELQTELKAGNTEDAISISNDIKDNGEKINLHGKRAEAIVKGMLQHSQKSSGKKEPTDINALADEYLRLSYHGFRAKDKSFNAVPINIGIETHFDESIGKIEVVPQDIGRVLLNLFNNAFYAVIEKKKAQTLKGENYDQTVWVTTKKENDRVIIMVRDNGIGIPQKVVDKIFQPFFTTKPTGQGTGLGLSLSYDIIKAHGGEIRVESKEGEGSAFIIEWLVE